MSRLNRLWISLFICVLSFTITPIPHHTFANTSKVSDEDLAYRWAPVHYQDTDDTDADADYITGIDFDGDWDTQNNWEHQDDKLSRLKAEVYYSIAETKTHWYIIYGFYHPRDWDDGFFFNSMREHENDMEGVLEIIRKDGSKYGKLEGMITVFHRDFYSFVPKGSPLTDGNETIDGKVHFVKHDQQLHPTTFQEAKGHGLKAWNNKPFPGGDGVIYYPDRKKSEVPKNGNDRHVKYKLVNIFKPNGLWDHRFDPKTFASWGTFRGDNGKNNAAHAPWFWDDHNDGPKKGAMAFDPAYLTDDYFNGLGKFSKKYIRNPYTK